MVESHAISRVLLALDISPRSRSALDAAALLAAALDAELAGLFVEDLNLLRLSELPFAREIGSFSSVSRPLVPEQVQQALHREAGEAQRLLAQTAARLRLRWSFQVARGQTAVELCAQAGQCDLVVLGKRSRSGLRAFGQEMAGLAAAAGPVLAVYDGSPRARRMLELAQRLARERGVELRLLIAAANEEDYQRCLAEAQAALAAPNQPAPASRRLIATTTAALAAAVRAQHAVLLVLCANGHLRSAEGFSALLDEVDCPVVLVR